MNALQLFVEVYFIIFVYTSIMLIQVFFVSIFLNEYRCFISYAGTIIVVELQIVLIAYTFCKS